MYQGYLDVFQVTPQVFLSDRVKNTLIIDQLSNRVKLGLDPGYSEINLLLTRVA